jgi:ribosome-associated toxin RatA of RatAB toxin-antitoxin module
MSGFMKTVRQSVIVARPAAAMFRLVDECEHYPDFLPWCGATTVHSRTPIEVKATLQINYHGLQSTITTLNRMAPPDRIDLEFVEGPFERFHGHWRFTQLGTEGCRVEFDLEYEFASVALEKVLAPVFGYVTETLVDRFVERAESMPSGDGTGP